jgi:protoheme IX farnesyltransferase
VPDGNALCSHRSRKAERPEGRNPQRVAMTIRRDGQTAVAPVTSVLPRRGGWSGWRCGASARLVAYWHLTKPDITLLVTFTAWAAFYLGVPSPAGGQGPGAHGSAVMWHLSAGVVLLSFGIFALNHYLERDLDRLMRRTAARPLPSGRLTPREALIFGGSLTVASLLYLALCVNALAALLGAVVAGSYLLLYTPLKVRTPLATTVGAFPGAMPPLVGWAAARGELGLEAWVLFAILFLWQFPHFHALGWMYRQDYARAGMRVLSVVEPDGRRTMRQIAVASLLLVPVGALPWAIGLAGPVYGATALGLGIWYAASGLALARSRTNAQARRLLLVSVLYPLLLFGALVLNKH